MAKDTPQKVNNPYIIDLLRPLPVASNGDRRVWSIPLNAIWLPFFTGTNVNGETTLSNEALGAPLRLAKDKDGSVKFSSKGKPVLRVAQELSDQVRMVKENFIASLVRHTGQVQKANPTGYKAQVEAARQAGEPILISDAEAIKDALEQRAKERACALAEALSLAQTDQIPEPVAA